MICRVESCDKSVAKDSFYCAPCKNEISDRMKETVELIYPLAQSVYFGRTHFPEKRLLEHLDRKGYDRLTVLHWALSKGEASNIEESLIKVTRDWLKSDWQEASSRGRWAGNLYAIYVAWKLKNGAKVPWKEREVLLSKMGKELVFDHSTRLWPERPGLFRPVHLITRATVAQAAKLGPDTYWN